jgi:hypothetical protein
MATAKSTVPRPEPPAVALTGVDSNGSRIFLVPSASGSAAARSPVFHVVTLEASRTRCTCPAATFGRVCRHQRAVTDHLLREIQARLECASRSPHPGDTAAPHRDSRPFSLFK